LKRQLFLNRLRGGTAAVIVEPVAANSGVILPKEGFLQGLRQVTAEHGALLIFDEVITGFGRLGKPFASEYFGVTPDLITFAKGVTNGTVPLGGVIVTRAIYDTFMQASRTQMAARQAAIAAERAAKP
jgi:beta-alanine--pyruvate transaminase